MVIRFHRDPLAISGKATERRFSSDAEMRSAMKGAALGEHGDHRSLVCVDVMSTRSDRSLVVNVMSSSGSLLPLELRRDPRDSCGKRQYGGANGRTLGEQPLFYLIPRTVSEACSSKSNTSMNVLRHGAQFEHLFGVPQRWDSALHCLRTTTSDCEAHFIGRTAVLPTIRQPVRCLAFLHRTDQITTILLS